VTHTSPARAALREKNLPPVMHPLVRTHPDNGTKAIYFSQNRVENIIGMDPHESQTLLEKLLGHAVRPEFVYSHTWRLGDMLIWDNRAAMHKANYDYDPTDPNQKRPMYRILVKGERPL
jgi:taurine dioxygenase